MLLQDVVSTAGDNFEEVVYNINSTIRYFSTFILRITQGITRNPSQKTHWIDFLAINGICFLAIRVMGFVFHTQCGCSA